MDVQNRLRNAKRPSFSMWSHHWLTRNGGLVTTAKPGKMLLEALFSDSRYFDRQRRGSRQDLSCFRVS
jgi:hypothetical protein